MGRPRKNEGNVSVVTEVKESVQVNESSKKENGNPLDLNSLINELIKERISEEVNKLTTADVKEIADEILSTMDERIRERTNEYFKSVLEAFIKALDAEAK